MNKSLVMVLSNLSMTMCHAFIIDQAFMPPPIAFPKFLDEKEEMNAKWRSQIIENKFSPRVSG